LEHGVKRILIIGSGMGGLATALRLAYQGFEVTILEKQPRPGGRSNIIEEQGYRVDTGPTILVMKNTFEDTYRAIGQDFNQRLKLIQLDPNYRIYYHDNTHIDSFANMAKLIKKLSEFSQVPQRGCFTLLVIRLSNMSSVWILLIVTLTR
jgi:phytoene dehydrogenase-like protein